MNAIARSLSLFRWDQFATLTYGSNAADKPSCDPPAPMVRRRMLFQWWRQIAESYGVPWDLFIAAAREECGEKGGREHWHSLVGGLYHVPGRGVVPSPNPTSDTFRLVNLWTARCGKSAGIADSRAYDARLSGVEYILKGLEGWNYSTLAANAYEVAKFDDFQADRQLILTPALIRWLSMRSRNRRHLKAREVKKLSRDRSAPGVSNSVPTPARFVHPADTSLPRRKKSKSFDLWKPGKAMPNVTRFLPESE